MSSFASSHSKCRLFTGIKTLTGSNHLVAASCEFFLKNVNLYHHQLAGSYAFSLQTERLSGPAALFMLPLSCFYLRLLWIQTAADPLEAELTVKSLLSRSKKH